MTEAALRASRLLPSQLRSIRTWPVWSLPGWLTPYVLAVVAVDLAAIAFAARAASFSTHDLGLFCLLLGCTAVAVELTRKVGEKGGVSFTWNDAIFPDAGGPAWGVVNYVDSFHDQLTYFLDHVIPGRAAPLSALQDAADALAIIAAAEVSAQRKGAATTIDYRPLSGLSK